MFNSSAEDLNKKAHKIFLVIRLFHLNGKNSKKGNSRTVLFVECDWNSISLT